MSGIVLSASVRQNLLSLQSTASLLAKTQNDLATGNKVNSALDNPTNFFTAQSLNNRASDIGNLLDGIGNGVQVLQAANTGLTSLQGLVASAQSIANQVLQTPTGYSTKSNVTSAALTGATASNLLNSSSSATGSVVNNDNTGTACSATTARGRSSTATSAAWPWWDASALIFKPAPHQALGLPGVARVAVRAPYLPRRASAASRFTALFRWARSMIWACPVPSALHQRGTARRGDRSVTDVDGYAPIVLDDHEHQPEPGERVTHDSRAARAHYFAQILRGIT